MKKTDLLKQLSKDGWVRKAQKGSHLQLVHPTKKGKVTFPRGKGDIPIGTARAILRQAGLL